MNHIDRRSERAFVVVVLGGAIAAVMALPLLSTVSGQPVSLFTRDVFSIAEIPVYAGLYSNLGVLLWGATCVIALYTAWIAGDRLGWGRERGVLVCFGALSGLLMADDFFLVHEWIAPEFLAVPERVVFGLYAAFLAGSLLVFRRALLERRPGWLAVALTLFAASTGMDVIERPPAPAWHYFAEESLKLIGIAAWFLFFALFAADTARTGISSSPRPTRSRRRTGPGRRASGS